MSKIRINKIEAARRQIDAAIRMLFSNENPIAIFTIANAGYRILLDIAELRKDISAHERSKDLIRPGMEKEYWRYVNAPVNFLKHADKDPEAILDNFNEESNEATLLIACFYYKDMGYRLPPEMTALATWFMVNNPKVVKDDAPIKKEIVKNFVTPKNLPRAALLELGKRLLEEVKKSHKNY